KLVSKSKKLSEDRIRTVLQSVLFVADKPLTVDQLYEVAGGWQFRTDPHSAEYVRRYLRVKPQRLTRAAVETLAIIAYRQPATRPEIEDIRGVDCGAVIKALLDRKLIKILGKKEEVGRPMLYGTTREFLEFFALKDLSALPTLREFHELTQEHQEIVEKERPAAPSASGTVELLADPDFQKRMDKSVAASEAALEELEQAMDAAEKTQKAATSILNPTPPPPEGDKGPAEPA
ncbi:MAG TPA: SMC-Scp complex subunit ScpB, partial [Archangium sp.]|nr:SMC-Scp complex subunit ScpB [Archangium sp.]